MLKKNVEKKVEKKLLKKSKKIEKKIGKNCKNNSGKIIYSTCQYQMKDGSRKKKVENRRPVPSTDQAIPCCIYFRIS